MYDIFRIDSHTPTSKFPFRIIKIGTGLLKNKMGGPLKFRTMIEAERFLKNESLIKEFPNMKKNPRPRIGTKSPKRRSSATGKAPSKRLVARRKSNTRKGYFPNPKRKTWTAKSYAVAVRKKPRTPAQKAATARMLAANRATRAKKNPVQHITRKPRGKIVGGRRKGAFRHMDRMTGNFKYFTQVYRNKKWITLARFETKGAATDYGRALQALYRSKQFRVFWNDSHDTTGSGMFERKRKH